MINNNMMIEYAAINLKQSHSEKKGVYLYDFNVNIITFIILHGAQSINDVYNLDEKR